MFLEVVGLPYNKAREVAYLRDRARGVRRYVDAEPTRERLQRLVEAGVPVRAVARVSGVSDQGVSQILAGERVHVQRFTAQRVEAVTLSSVYGEQARGHVPNVGAVRRVQALMAMGWRHDDLAAAGAANTRVLLAQKDRSLVTVARWRQIRDVYDRLSMAEGPSERTRRQSRARGYAPPLAWDEDTIDDPGARPAAAVASSGHNAGGAWSDVDPVAIERAARDATSPVSLNRAERVEVVRVMAVNGASDEEIAQRIGRVARTVLRIRQEHDIPTARPMFAPGTSGGPEPSLPRLAAARRLEDRKGAMIPARPSPVGVAR